MDDAIQTVEARFRRIAADQLGVAIQNLKLNGTVTDNGCDSLDAVELVMAIEDEFKFEVPDSDASKLYPAPLQEWLQYVEARRSAASA